MWLLQLETTSHVSSTVVPTVLIARQSPAIYNLRASSHVATETSSLLLPQELLKGPQMQLPWAFLLTGCLRVSCRRYTYPEAVTSCRKMLSFFQFPGRGPGVGQIRGQRVLPGSVGHQPSAHALVFIMGIKIPLC